MIPLWNRCVRNTPRRCWNDLCQPLGLLPTAVGAPSPEVTRPGVGSLGWGQAAQCRVGLGGGPSNSKSLGLRLSLQITQLPLHAVLLRSFLSTFEAKSVAGLKTFL